MLSSSVSVSEVAHAVGTFNRHYGEMEKVLWCLSRASRMGLLQGESNQALAVLLWTVKDWWGVRGMEEEMKTVAMSALATMNWTTELFEESSVFSALNKEYARECTRVLLE